MYEIEYAAFKFHYITNLMYTTSGRGILDGYLNLKREVAKHLSLIDSLEEALNHLRIKWLNWDEFVEKRRKFEWTRNDKKLTRLNLDSKIKLLVQCMMVI
jgi:hypothetical protein